VTGSILASGGGIPPVFVKFYPYKPKFVTIQEMIRGFPFPRVKLSITFIGRDRQKL
jgi:hypothetical protein